jgi:hypothetical protein
MPPQSTVVFEITLPGAQAPVAEELELEVALDAALELAALELLLALLLDAALEAELALEDEVPLGTEHSLTPPATLVPLPKVTSPQTKLPDRVL